MSSYKEWPSVLAGLMLILAIFAWPYEYYVFLRWVVAICAIYIAIKLHENGDNAMWAFILLAIVFNPLIPINGTRAFWLIPDLVGGAIFLSLGRKQNLIKNKD